jgi:hypothetical protein
VFDFVEVRLAECEEALAAAQAICRRDVASRILSDQLLYHIRDIARDCQSALDAVTGTVSREYLTTSNPEPRFPLATSPAEFVNKLEEQLPGLLCSRPAVALAFERHQPYQRGSRELGYLHTLAHADKRTDFSKQKRTEVVEIERVAGGGFIVSVVDSSDRVGDRGLTTTYERIDMRSSDPEIVRYLTRSVFVGWNFVDPPGPILQTLQALAQATREAVIDIVGAAGLSHIDVVMAAHGSMRR